MARPPDPPEDLPPPPAAQPTDRWGLDPTAVVPGRQAAAADRGGTPPPPRRRPRTALIAVIGALIVLAAAGGAAAYFVLRGSSADLLERVPADMDVVAIASLDPSAGQKVNLVRIADAFPDIGGVDGARERLEEWADPMLEEVGLRLDDITSWLGVEIAVALEVVDGTPQVAMLVDVEDRDGAEAMLAKLRVPGAPWEDVAWTEREYLGTTLTVPEGASGTAPSYAFDDDVLILTSEPSLLEDVIDTHRGTTGSIATAASFQEAEAELPEDRLLFAFVDTASLRDDLQQAVAAEAVTSLGGLGDLEAVDGIGLTLSAVSEGVALDVVASYDASALTGALREQVTAPDHENLLLQAVPKDAWGLFGAQHLDIAIREAVAQLEADDPAVAADLREAGITGTGGLLDVLSGDLAIAVAPDETTSVGGVLLASVGDGAEAADAVERVAATLVELSSSGGVADDALRWKATTADDGTRISYLPDGFVAYALRDDMLVVGTSLAQVEGVLTTGVDGALTDDPAFVAGTEGVPAEDSLFYVDIGRVIRSIREALPADERDAFDEEVGRDLRTLRSVAFGVDMNGSRQLVRMLVTIAPDDEATS
jgi:hypothetical protein